MIADESPRNMDMYSPDDTQDIDALIDLLSSAPRSPQVIRFGKMEKQKKKVDTSVKPNVRYEINRLARVFACWVPDDMKAADRNKQELTETQTWAVVYAIKGGVTVGQVAETLNVSVARIQQIVRDAKAIQTQKESDGRLSISGTIRKDDEAAVNDAPTLASRVRQQVSITDTSPRI
jgi:hypothetical protein